MEVLSITVGPFASNCHMVVAPGKQALVVDPGGEPDAILELISKHRLTVAAFLITHGHVDHVHALAEVSAKHPALIGMHPLDSAWAFSPVNSIPPYYDAPRAPRSIDREWRNGQTWTDAGLTYRVIETPGHSPGSVSFYFESAGVVFPGDVLFKGSIGRTDLPGGDAGVLAASLEIMKALPDETVVYPGHGPATTIGREKATNYFLK